MNDQELENLAQFAEKVKARSSLIKEIARKRTLAQDLADEISSLQELVKEVEAQLEGHKSKALAALSGQ